MNTTNKKVRILSIDGGGIRGIIPAVALEHIESYLAKKKPGTKLSDHFDMIAGTSTGGILSGILLCPDDNRLEKPKAKYTATDALNFYIDEGYSIFNASKISNIRRLWGMRSAVQFSPRRIESLFHQYFQDTKISELIRPCLITTYNMVDKSAYFFTSREDQRKREFFLKDVLRSTSAAPTYFPPARINNIAENAEQDQHPPNMVNLDGGVFANNPVMCAYAEARNFNFEEREVNKPTASQMQILSIGTGGGGFDLEEGKKSHKWSLLKWAKKTPDIMMDGHVDTVAFQMNEIYETLQKEDRNNYFRMDVPAIDEFRDYSSDMTDASAINIKKLRAAGEKNLCYWRLNGLDDFLDRLDD